MQTLSLRCSADRVLSPYVGLEPLPRPARQEQRRGSA
jgi:hypothetical protein